MTGIKVEFAVNRHNQTVYPATATATRLKDARIARLFTTAYRDAVEKKLESPIDVACAATDGAITKDLLMENWNSLLKCVAQRSHRYRYTYNGTVFGGAIRDLILGLIPNDFDVRIISDTPDATLVATLDKILDRYPRHHITAEVVSQPRRYFAVHAEQLRIHIAHPTNPVLSISADISFSPEHEFIPDFDVNSLVADIPLALTEYESVCSGETESVIDNIKNRRMRRTCALGHTASCKTQDKRYRLMVSKGFTDDTVYDCHKPPCVRASADAKKKWIEENYVNASIIQSVRLACINDFNETNMVIDYDVERANTRAELDRLDAHQNACPHYQRALAVFEDNPCEECKYREISGNTAKLPKILHNVVRRAMESIARELAAGFYKKCAEQLSQCVDGASDIKRHWLNECLQSANALLGDTDACCDKLLAIVKETVSARELTVDSIGQAQVDELSKLQYYEIRERILPRTQVDYIAVDIIVRGKLIGHMSLRDIQDNYCSRVQSMRLDCVRLLPREHVIDNIRSLVTSYMTHGCF